MDTIRRAHLGHSRRRRHIGCIEAWLAGPACDRAEHAGESLMTVAADAGAETVELLRRSGADVRDDGSDERQVLWEKLARQAPVAAATALTQRRSASCAATRPGVGGSRRPSPRRARSPARTASTSRRRRSGRSSTRMPPALTSSPRVTSPRGRPSELDAITGAAVRAAHRLGVPAPGAREVSLDEAEAVCRAAVAADPGPLRVGARARTRTSARSPGIRFSRMRSRRAPAAGIFERVVVLDRQRQDRRGRALVRGGRAVPASTGVRDVDIAGHRVAALHARPARRAVRPVRDRPRDESVPRAGRRAPRAASSCSRRPRPTRSVRSSSSSSTRARCGSWTARRCGRCSTSRSSTLPGTPASTRRSREIYVQNSALEIAWTRVVSETGTREGRVLAPFFTEGHEGFNVDDEEDWERAERSRGPGAASLPGRAPVASVSSGGMKVAQLETLYCDAGWRPWIFLKATTDDGPSAGPRSRTPTARRAGSPASSRIWPRSSSAATRARSSGSTGISSGTRARAPGR